jgi:hypothetical protein
LKNSVSFKVYCNTNSGTVTRKREGSEPLEQGEGKERERGKREEGKEERRDRNEGKVGAFGKLDNKIQSLTSSFYLDTNIWKAIRLDSQAEEPGEPKSPKEPVPTEEPEEPDDPDDGALEDSTFRVT